MTFLRIPVITAALVASISPVRAQNVPYKPTFLLEGQDSKIYQFSAASLPQFSVYDITNTLNGSDTPQTITNTLPFLSSGSNSFVPIVVNQGIQVFSGECSEGVQELNLWNYGFGSKNQTWTQMQTTSTDSVVGANFLSAAFAFSNSDAMSNDTLYVFGGMCPSANASGGSWTEDATYSNTMLTITPETTDDYEVSLTGQRAPPVAEAGLSITPLNASTVGSAKQQNFVLIGGHTQNAFINMSQVAMFSLPEQAWAFIGIDQPLTTTVEPRSGHTAVISEDRSKIFVFGGWVGDTTNPANPQLAVLHVGQDYGGNGSWAWTVPVQTANPFSAGQGIYGHGAIMLPGDIIMVAGGFSISKTSSKAKRNTSGLMFYNTTSATWMTSYTNPVTLAKTEPVTSGLTSSQKTGLGAGLGIGIAAVIMMLLVWFVYARRLRQKRIARERELREMALGTDRGYSNTNSINSNSGGIRSESRSVSWVARQEQNIETSGARFPWLSANSGKQPEQSASDQGSVRVVDRGGATLDVPSPTRGLRKNLHSRGLPGFGTHLQSPAVPGGVFRIDEEDEERSQRGSIKRVKTSDGGSARPLSDPFKDPPNIQPEDEPAEQRRQEVRKWVEDWASAAESMNLSRSPSKANSRTYSNLSAYNSSSSGDKSDRTESNLSERSNRSNLSIQRSATGTVSRSLSQRSASAGYALFAGASAAMGRIAGRPQDSTQNQSHQQLAALDRTASKRSISTGDLAQLASRKRSNSVEQSNQVSDSRNNTITSRDDEAVADFWTPPESPIKDYKNKTRDRSNSLTNQSRKALGVLSQATKRVLSGAGKVGDIDSKNGSGQNSPTKYSVSGAPEMSEVMPRRVLSTGANVSFWKHKQGARDWDVLNPHVGSSGTVRRRSGRAQVEEDSYVEPSKREEGDDWDVEQAVQQRVVQVMFTVPKEKLRVVNADNLSLVSRSDTNASRESKRSVEGIVEGTDGIAVNRMSRVTEKEGEDDDQHAEVFDSTTAVESSLHPSSAETGEATGKGKERAIEKQRSGETIGKAL
ncbi:hypothetical protein H2198_007562 [Neophaeococcomyces mojaviensis]|uniref:Uncharacterized protein n=1 Tax=Neophaeococcomyces mojaviensis TaxID=3383035 RepID=A0ACC3A065_9EURO|nr:hypothetical protein H2198_007562 [Knufia sp. JES_112]